LQSDSFKNQTDGAMTKTNASVIQNRLKKAEARLKGRPKKVVDKIKETASAVVDKVAPVIEETTTAVKNAAAEVTKAVKEANAVKISPTFRAVVEAVSDTLKKPELAVALADSAGDFVKQMKRYGVETRAQFESFVEQFPDMQDNVEFFKQLDEAYPNTISADEITDFVKTKSVETLQKMKDAYTKLFPGCTI
jgi:5,10-methenyltetrahydromethanopterin hydrogenase